MAEPNQQSCLEVVSELLSRCETESTVFPPTDLYNEGWLLRIILDYIGSVDSAFSASVYDFYQKCLIYGRSANYPTS